MRCVRVGWWIAQGCRELARRRLTAGIGDMECGLKRPTGLGPQGTCEGDVVALVGDDGGRCIFRGGVVHDYGAVYALYSFRPFDLDLNAVGHPEGQAGEPMYGPGRALDGNLPGGNLARSTVGGNVERGAIRGPPQP